MSDEHEQNKTEDPNWKHVRDKLEALEQTNARLQAEVLEARAERLGLDPSKGVVKLALKEFSQTEDQSSEALKTFAVDLGLLTVDPDEQQGGNQPSQEDVERQQQALMLTQRQQDLQSIGRTPDPVPDIQAQIKELEDKGEYGPQTLALKLQQAQQMVRGL